jgi:hypothetical protein
VIDVSDKSQSGAPSVINAGTLSSLSSRHAQNKHPPPDNKQPTASRIDGP